MGNYDATTWTTKKTNSTLNLEQNLTIDAANNANLALVIFVAGNGATVNVSAKIDCGEDVSAIMGNGTVNGTYNYGGTLINVLEGANIKSGTSAIYLPQNGETNIYGGYIEGYSAIGIKSGKLNIFGGHIVGAANDNDIGNQYSSGGGIASDGSAIMIDSNISYAGQLNINMTGGTVEGKYSWAFCEIGKDSANVLSLNISGGYVIGGALNSNGAIKFKHTPEDVIHVTGGSFSSDPTNWLESDHSCSQVEGKWTVK